MQIDDSAPTLPLSPLDPRLPLGMPFTPAMARAVGVPRSALDRMLRDGLLRRVLRGVYVDATVLDDPETRARSVALVLPRGAVVVDRTAAWLHGVEVLRARCDLLPPLEVLGRSAAGRPRHFGAERTLISEDVETPYGVPVTTPLRTALDLGRLLAPDRALASMDALLRTHRFTHRELLLQVERFRHQKGVVQLRRLAPIVDARASCPAESILRVRWLEASLPTPIPRLRASTGAGWLELALGLEVQRFAAVLAGQLSGEEREQLTSSGWRIVVLTEERVIRSDPYLVMRHLEREFHQQLLRQVS
jgi:hypothetical protein